MEHGRKKIRGVGIEEEASFFCSRCSADPKCLVCHKDKLETAEPPVAPSRNDAVLYSDGGSKDDMQVDDGAGPSTSEKLDIRVEGAEAPEEADVEMEEDEGYLRFRCFRCKQEAHYEHCKYRAPPYPELSCSMQPFYESQVLCCRDRASLSAAYREKTGSVGMSSMSGVDMDRRYCELLSFRTIIG